MAYHHISMLARSWQSPLNLIARFKSCVVHNQSIIKHNLQIHRRFHKRRQEHNHSDANCTIRKKKGRNVQQQHQRQVEKSKDNGTKKSYNLFASTLPGLERILSHELESKICIEKNNQTITKGGISFEVSSVKDLYRCHLLLGVASHLYLRANVGVASKNEDEELGNIPNEEPNKESKRTQVNGKIKKGTSTTSFYAVHEKQLVQKVRNMNFWREIISVKNPKDVPIIDIKVSASKSKLHHTKMIADLVRKGIHQSLGFGNNNTLALNDAFNKCFNEDGPKIRVLVRILYDEVEISIDTSQSPLHRRGYKLNVRKAPLREDIAFGLLYAMGWGNNSEESRLMSNNILIDPFCGSGTILIEGASMKMGLPPGRLRSTPLKHTSLYDERLWSDLITHEMTFAEKKIDEESPTNYPLIVGGDRDGGAIEATIANAQRAGVDKVIQVKGCALKNNAWFNPQTIMSLIDKTQPSHVFVATNPPFGLRISSSKRNGKQNELLPLYQSFGSEVAKLKGLTSQIDGTVNVGLIAHDIDLGRKTGVADLKSLFTTQLGGISVVTLSDSKNIIKS